MTEFKFQDVINQKSFVIDEDIRERVYQLFKNEQALRYSSENLNILAEAQRQAAWQEVFKRYPMLSDYKAHINFITWECSYEKEEYTREGESVIEEVHEVFDEVHTPPLLESFCGIGEKDGN